MPDGDAPSEALRELQAALPAQPADRVAVLVDAISSVTPGLPPERASADVMDNWVRRLVPMGPATDGALDVHIQGATIVRPAPLPELRPGSLQPVTESAWASGPAWGPAGGLWTSPDLGAGAAAWQLWMERGPESGAFTGDARAWAVVPRAGVHRITIDSAGEWVDLIRRHPRQVGKGLVAPDWVRIGAAGDAVTFTWRAVAATQGMQFEAPLGLTVPAYLSTESTWWTNWCFESVHPLTRHRFTGLG